MKSKTLCVIVLLAALSSCAGSELVRIDLTSDATFENSLNAMQRSLSREERANLMIALLRIRMSGIGSAEDAQFSVGDGQVLSANAMNRIDGLTYSEIMSLANKSGVNAEVLK